MSDFSFTATASCEKCGAYLQSSDEVCEHGGQTVKTHVFRKIGCGRESIVGVDATIRHKWQRLEERVGDDWIKYEWLGSKESVNNMLKSNAWSSVSELPSQATSLDAPDDVIDDQ